MTMLLTRREPVRLTFQDGQVMVTPKDRDVFFINAEKATEACRNIIRQEERVTRFTDEFILPLGHWCEGHRGLISACYVVMPESAVLPVYMIAASERYNFELTEQLSALALWFEDQGWSVHLSQIPRCAPEDEYGFFNPDRALQIHG